ncbi:MAG TPA: host attachment protein [Vitreimonas sp.]|nr:host attachment protein [Vitreimonas sp.]
MLQNGPAWFLLADGRRARVLIEERRGAALQAPGEWEMEIGPEEIYEPQDRPPRGFASVGGGRHAIDRGTTLHEQEESKFLKRVAERIAEADKRKQFEHLVIAAPPRALGALRELLPHGARARIRAETPKDLIDENESSLRERLRDLLRKAS